MTIQNVTQSFLTKRMLRRILPPFTGKSMNWIKKKKDEVDEDKVIKSSETKQEAS